MWTDILFMLAVVVVWLLIAPCSPLRGACAWKRPDRPPVERSDSDQPPGNPPMR
jgi:fatty acid desaturase